MNPVEAATAIGALCTGVGALSAWVKVRRTQSIVQGNGQGNVAKMAEATLAQLSDIRKLLVDHITDGERHAAGHYANANRHAADAADYATNARAGQQEILDGQAQAKDVAADHALHLKVIWPGVHVADGGNEN